MKTLLSLSALLITLTLTAQTNTATWYLNDTMSYGLFVYDDDIFYCDRVIEGLSDIYTKSKKASESAKIRHQKEAVNKQSFDSDLGF